MTLIAAFAHRNFPLLVGDLAVSNNESGRTAIHVPTTGRITSVFPEGSGYTIVGLRQKIAIISPNCAIAFAGSMLMAAHVTRELRKIGAQRPIAPPDIPGVVAEAMREMRVDPVSVVGWLNLGGSVGGFEGRASFIESERFGPIAAAGSGVDQLKKWLAPESRGPTREIETGDVKNDALRKAFSLVGVFLQTEVRTAETLLNYFGGGFEVAAFNGRGFSKVGDITFALWEVFESGDDLHFTPGPTCILKQDYDGDLLLIQSLLMDLTGKEPKVKDVAVNAILPLDRVATEADKSKTKLTSWESTATLHIFVVRFESREIAVMTRLEVFSNPTDRWFKLRGIGEGVEIGFREDFLMKMNEEIRTAAAQRRAQIESASRGSR